jgi:hypothetical protein
VKFVELLVEVGSVFGRNLMVVSAMPYLFWVISRTSTVTLVKECH